MIDSATTFSSVHTRDLLCNGIADVTRQMPSTTDLDIAVAIPASGTRYQDKVAHLEPSLSGSDMRFHLPADADVPNSGDVPIDVIPFGDGVRDVRNIRVDRDRTLDASGIAEAADDPLHVRVHPTLTITVPRLHSLVGLKLLAYGLRSAFAEYKDARDLAFLFEALTSTTVAWEDHFNHVSSLPDDALVDSVRSGPWLAGARMRATFGDDLIQRMLAAVDTHLATRMTHYGWQGIAAPPIEEYREQLDWLRRGSMTAGAGFELEPWPPRMPEPPT